MALATELAVPLLVTERLRRTYGYIDDVRAVVTRPAAMSEVQALKALGVDGQGEEGMTWVEVFQRAIGTADAS